MIGLIDLKGKWQLHLAEDLSDELPNEYEEIITLPDTVSHARKGNYVPHAESGFMTDLYKFEGKAWYRRYLNVSEDITNCCLFFERTRITTVFIDGEKIGTRDNLCTPHRYNIPVLRAGRHEIVVCVSNVNYPTKGGHLTSPDTQTNWNGITGKLWLMKYGISRSERIRVSTNIDRKSVIVRADIIGPAKTATLWVEGVERRTVSVDKGKLEFEYVLGDAFRLWSEYERIVYKIFIDVDGDIESADFGLRNISTDGLTLKVNNLPVFLRGKHDGMVFPLTGYAPTNVNAWLEVLSTAKKYGINHYRFHTCCPPDSAFTAADILGVYMEPELPFWGTISAPGEDGYNEEEQNYLISEGYKILDEFGNHPSFVMMSMGNELWGNPERINEIVSNFKCYDNRHLYTGGSNIFQFVPTVLPADDFFCGVRFDRERLIRGSYAMCDAPQGHIQTEAPNSAHNYDKFIVPENNVEAASSNGGTIEIQYGTGVKTVEAKGGDCGLIPNVPVISHEVGQYAMYPDFDEEKLYTGPIKPLYLELWKQRLSEKGIFPLWKEYFKASSVFAADCYKLEIEAALGSRCLSGFQLLDLQDFPGQGVALVGVLNSLMKSKGILSAKQWRCFCDDTVLLCRLNRFVYTAGEKVIGKVCLSACNFHSIPAGKIVCRVDGEVVQRIEFTKPQERLVDVGEIEIITDSITTPKKLNLRIELENTNIYNEYSLWVYPDEKVTVTEKEISYGNKAMKIVHNRAEAEKLKEKGEVSLLIPEPDENSIEESYCTDFWNYPMFSSISKSMNKKLPQGTLGIYADTQNPIMKAFLSENHTTPNWYNFIIHSHSRPVNQNCSMIAEVIDNADRGLRLGLLYEQNGILTCTSRLWEIADCPEIKVLAKAILQFRT